MPLTETEERELTQLRARGILTDLAHHKVSPKVIVVACGDGHEYGDIFDHHRQICGNGGGERPMIHQHLTNGGALVLQADTALNHGLPGDELLLAQIGDSLQIKKVNSLVLRVHAPCGAARLIGLSPDGQVGALREARSRLIQTYPDVSVACYMDVRYADGRQRTYFVPTTKA